ncbi:hypothetical protein B7P43_G11805 [Cryptotermes secundus]|uniref:E3 SUMO-protein ligase RanBP2 n=4 Tax=Cryptotermes secundus TaxID=105785 RepID=A0A2J7PRR2_9NEOP|nr:hypothetical protein B7P43_G11805 [Cryptotermes secundus]
MQSTWLLQATETRKKSVDLWAKEAAYRNSQAGHVLHSMVRERRSQFLDRVTQFCSGNWRERVFQRIFTTRDHQQGMSHSHFVNFQGFSDPPLRLPTPSELLPHDEKSQKLHPSSLHHLVWLGLQDVPCSNKKNSSLKPGPDFHCQVFEGLQLTCNNLNCAGSETLNRLDIDSFLYAAVFCASATQDEQQAAGYWSSDRPVTLPANITEQLCTVSQAKWWAAAYRVFTNQAKGDLGELRQTLQRGIEVVRVLGNHGLDVKLVVHLAQTFEQRASTMAARTEGSSDLPAIEARASLYWTAALPLLERLQRNQTIRAPHTRLFEYQGKELSSAEVNALIEEGRFFLACQLMKEDKHEKAIEAFQQLKSPYASFYQATIYKKLAAEELQDQRREMITSEMRSQHIILLTKARECFYLTLDRLRSPGVDAKHPLNAELNSHIEDIESQLSRIDPDVMLAGVDAVNRNECDGMSDDSVSSAPSGADNLNNSLVGLGNSSSLYLQHSSLNHLTPRYRGSAGGQKHTSTPYRSNIHKLDSSDVAPEHPRRTEARPSPERLDAQIRHLVHSKDAVIHTILEQNKALLEQSKAVVDGLKENKLVMEEIKNQIQELRKDTLKARRGQTLNLGQSNINAADLAQVCDTEEDIYVFDEEDYSEDVNLAAAQLGQYQAFPPYPPNYTNYRGMTGILATPSSVSYPAPHSGSQTPLLPPQTAIGGFFRGVDPAAAAASLMYPPTLSYYAGQGALPFSEGQQLPNFGSAGPGIPAQAASASVFSRLGASADSPGSLHDPKVTGSTSVPQPLPLPLPSQHQQQSVGPVNVVITSSDTLPTSAPTNQPTLSVTIPPQHRLGTPLVKQPTTNHLHLQSTTSAFTSTTAFNSTSISSTTQSSVPHAFQISMPPQAQLPHASILEKGAASLSPVLPISTGMLLSSVPSPVYSALEKSPAGKNNVAGAGHVADVRRVSTGSAIGVEDGEEGYDAEHDPCPDFQPVIPLPAEVELTTGEEEETVLFESRAKLFRYVDKEWKERGVGTMKLLHNQMTGKVRVLMRREQVLKICANHNLRSDMELTQMNNRAWMWVALDFADEEVRLEKLCVRFKTSDEAANFKDAFDKAKLIVAATETSAVKAVASVPSVSTSAVTQEPSKIATKVVTSAITSPVPVTSCNKITVGGFTFASPPTFKIDSKSAAAQTLKDTTKDKEKGSGEGAKPSPFAGFSFTSPSKVSTSLESPVITGNVQVSEPTSLHRPRTIVPKSVGVTSTSDKVQIMPESGTPTSGSKLMFDSPHTDFTFSALAAVIKEPGFKKDDSFKGWEGAGKPVFGGSLKSEGVVENEGSAEEFVPTAEFEPVIPLPELVELKTGEEGENILFEERAKLLRFDSEGKQWKERGIGKLKIMQIPTTGKVRLLMRREQVLKVCCNHFVTADMKFTALSSSDRAWTWCAQDYSEGEMKPELLAVRFKTVEQALLFKKTLDEVQVKMSDEGKDTNEPTAHSMVWKCKECLFPNASVANHCTSCKRPKPREFKENPLLVSHSSNQQLKLFELSKSPESWECQSCCLINDMDSETCIGCKKPNSSKAADVSSALQSEPLSEIFKAKPGSWECEACYIRNQSTADLCMACETPKPGSNVTCETASSFSSSILPRSDQNVPLSELFKPKAGCWECSQCYTYTDADKTSCLCCGGPKPGHDVTQREMPGNATNQASFKFGMPSSGTEFNFSTSSQITSGQSDFTFGIAPGHTSEPVNNNFGMPISNISTSTATTTTITHALFTSSNACIPKGGFSFGLPSTTTTASSVTCIFGVDSTSTNKPFSFEPKANTGAFLFGSSAGCGTERNTSSLTFSFGSNIQAEGNRDSTPPKDTAGHKFTFGSPGKFEFSFSGVRPKSPTKQPKSPGSVGANVSGAAADDDSDGELEEDEGEHICFQPVIPLPDKVPLHTGEEDEDILYCHRAKLFRFTGGEWKERGVGDIKLLKHRSTHKVRLLMRRDHVLKLCLNHFLKPEITFREKDEKTWLWIAPDYSEGHLQEEMFSIRFKNKEIASEFKEAIDKAQAELISSAALTDTCLTAASSQDLETSPTPLNKTEAGPSNSISQAMKNFSFTLPAGSPTVLQSPNSGSPIFALPQFGTSSALGCARSLFGGSSVQQSVPAVDATRDRDDVEIVYELQVTPEEEAAAMKLKLPANFYSYLYKPPCPGCAGCETDSDTEIEVHKSLQDSTVKSDSAASSIQPKSSPGNESTSFTALKPTVLLRPSRLAATATTQPSESHSQKLAHETSPQQKVTSTSFATKALPQFVSSSLPTGTLFDQLLAQGQQTTSPTVFSFQSAENSVSQVTPGIFFGSLQTSAQHQSSLFPQQLSKTTHPQQLIASSNVNTSITSQTTLTSVFSHPQSSSATIFGQRTVQPVSLFSGISSTPTTTIMPPLGPGFTALGPKPVPPGSTGSSEATKPSGFVFSPAGSKPASVSDPVGEKPVNIRFSEVLGLKTTVAPSTQVSVDPVFSAHSASSGTSEPKHGGSSFIKTTEAAESSFQTKEGEGVPFLPVDSDLSFAKLASKSEKLGFKTDTNVSWAGGSSLAFSNTPKQQASRKGRDENDSSGDEGCADATTNGSHDPHFEPVIDLPDKIEVRTGEEDETKVFCHRAKLYRYEAATKEWKERGVGEMKILHHPINNTYRLLLRREQVHKVVCNHLVTNDLTLKPLSSSNRAWCWGALNYAEEDEPKVEELAVLFKLQETAKEFRDKLNECIEQVAKLVTTADTKEEPANPEVIRISQAESEDSEDNLDDEDAEDDDDDDEEEEDEEETEKSLMFEKRVTLQVQDPLTAAWSTQGLGDLQILYDPDIFGARICVERDGTGEQLCNTIIALNTVLEVKKRDCIWSGMDYSEDPAVHKKFMAKFSSEEAAAEFQHTFQEGKYLAEQAEIMEHVNLAELTHDED